MIYGAGMLIFAVIMLMDVITYTTWRNQLTRRRNQKYWSFSVLFAESGRRFNIQTARKNQSHWKSGPFFSDYLRENFQYFDRSGYIKFSRTDVLLIIFHYSSLDISTFTLNANPSINNVFWKLSVTLDESAVYLPIPTFAPFFSDTTSAKRIFVQCWVLEHYHFHCETLVYNRPAHTPKSEALQTHQQKLLQASMPHQCDWFLPSLLLIISHFFIANDLNSPVTSNLS